MDTATAAAARLAFERAALQEQTALEYRQLASAGFTWQNVPAPTPAELYAGPAYQLDELVATSEKPVPWPVLLAVGLALAWWLSDPKNGRPGSW